MRIGYLEDDREIAELVEGWLVGAGHQVSWTEHSGSFLQQVKAGNFDFLILDWELPGASGMDVLQQVRAVLRFELPILFCTQREAEADIVLALENGADDYLVKPPRKMELMARVTALARRAGLEQQTNEIIELGQYRMDLKHRILTKSGEPVTLTEKDFDVAAMLFAHVGRVLSRAYMLETIWGQSAQLNTRTVDVHVSRVRKALGLTPETGYRIKTIYQHGYRLEQVAEE